ncbi:MAG: hypothetical protein ABI614_02780 [Planctomycetota bacterium]
MSKLLFDIGRSCAGVLILFATSVSFAEDLLIENDQPEDFELIVTDNTGNAVPYRIPVGQTVPITLGSEKHVLKMITPGHKRELGRYNLAELAAQGPINLRFFETPVGETPDGSQIYQIMDQNGFRHAEKYDNFLRQLRRSDWQGTYNTTNGRRDGQLHLRDGKGNNGQLYNIKYVPGDTFYIVGDWRHDDQREGNFILKIDPKTPRQLKGYWRDEDGEWLEGSATRR